MFILKSIFFLILNVFRKAFRCFRGRRRLSKDHEPLSNIIVNDNGQNEMEQWNDWEFKNRKPASVEEHIEFYRQQQAKLRQQQQQAEAAAETNDQDLFDDMMPQITKQAKILIAQKAAESISHTPSLQVQVTEAYVTNELENWEDNSGWEADAIDAGELLREKKREERERRMLEQQQKRSEKANRPILGAKLVS